MSRLVRTMGRWLGGGAAARHGHQLVRWSFLRAMGGVYLIAFTSLRAQVSGLFGSRGILPISGLLRALGRRLGPSRYRLAPTLLWLDDSDQALDSLCRSGQIASGALLLDLAPRWSALAAWALYLSFVSAGREFLSFQWDALLLESGFLTILAAPRRAGRRAPPPSPVVVALMRWLVFRLYFESGLAKLQSGDPTWRKLRACRHYYETEPLPNRVGWYAHHLPRRVQDACTAAVLAIECAAPFFAFGPRRLRLAAFWLFTGLQGAFALTGNYGFFNLLSAVLGLWLLDDEALAGRARRGRGARRGKLAAAAELAVAAPLAVLSIAELGRRFERGRRLLAREKLRALQGFAEPFHLVNPYGLFAMMTLERPEISVEGSDDGWTWKEYELPYKAGDPSQPPRQVAPHQPRLDWQMWFAALGPPPAWFQFFLVRLLQGAPEVVRLLRRNPFPDHPPRYVRAVLYDYRVAGLGEHRRTGAWWTRERLGLYFPAIALAVEPELGPEERPPLQRLGRWPSA